MTRILPSIFTLYLYLIQIQPIISFSLEKSRTAIDCSPYVNDNQIVHMFPFVVHINPIIPGGDITRAKLDEDDHVIRLRIVNQQSIPTLISCLKYLMELEIINTILTDFKQTLIHLAPSLTHLRIYNTKITQLPKEIGQLKRLHTLKLSNTALQSLPKSIGSLPLLSMLDLSSNYLKTLPNTMKNLQYVQQMTLSNNPSLHSIQSLNGLPSLRVLDARDCSIELLPQNLPRLTNLYMTNNRLIKLNKIETLGHDTNEAKSFYFTNNSILTIPPGIRLVKNLSQLKLDCNQLQTLPTDMFELKTLSCLNLDSNQFSPRDYEKIRSNFEESIPNIKFSCL